MKKILISLFIGLLFHFSHAKVLEVVTSFSILGDLVKEIGGEKVHVSNLIDINKNPHYYAVTANDKIKLKNANVIFIQGNNFETLGILKAVNEYPDKIVDVFQYINQQDLLLGGHTHNHRQHVYKQKINQLIHQEKNSHVDSYDPHIWHNPKLVMKNIQAIKDGLIKNDPINQQYYEKRYHDYLAQLVALDNWIVEEFKKINMKNKVLVSVHSGLSYLSHRYGFRYFSLESGGKYSEVSAKHVASIIERIKKENIKYIFSEENSNLKLAELVSKATNIKVVGKLYVDSLTEQSGQASNYIQLMKHNINIITQYLK